MVHSSALAISIDDERLTCVGFSLGETIHLESFEFIANYFSSLSLSPTRNDAQLLWAQPTTCHCPHGWS
jgi:hypothetical protein